MAPPGDHLQDLLLDTRRPGRFGQWDLDVGASLIVGVHAGFNPVEMVDFVLGFVGVDIADDDGPKTEADETPTTDHAAPDAGAIIWTPLHEALWKATTGFQKVVCAVFASVLYAPI